MNKKLLVDCITFDVDKSVLNEAMAKGGPLVVQGVLQRAEAKNQNGRVYGKEILEREAQKYDDNFIRERRALGELDHPDSSVVNLKNVSHNVKRMFWNGNDLMGEVEILTTPSGNILKELLNCGIKLGISSRGMGSVKKNGDLREMTCRLGVTRHLKGGELGYDAEAMNYLTVFDMQVQEYRTINVNTLKQIKFEGVTYEI